MPWSSAPARAALASLCEGITDVSTTHAYGPSVTALPAVVIGAPSFRRDGGMVTMEFPVYVLVAATGQTRAAQIVDEIVERVVAVIETDPTWAGTVRAAVVIAGDPGAADDLTNLETYSYTLTARCLIPC